jgi:small GTP-binding protein
MGLLITLMVKDYKYAFKITLAGNGSVGKTTLVKRFCEGVFQRSYKMTIGVDIMSKKVEIEGTKHLLQIWDLAGQEQFRLGTLPAFMRGVTGVLYVVDRTDKRTLYGSNKIKGQPEGLAPWETDVHRFVDPTGSYIPPAILLGNKSDLPCSITEGEIENYAEPRSWGWTVTSAKTGKNVEKAFVDLTKMIMKYQGLV